MSVKVAVIGTGYLGQHHARIYSELPGAELVGVVDTDMARATEIAARHNVTPMGSIDEALDSVDALLVKAGSRFSEQGTGRPYNPEDQYFAGVDYTLTASKMFPKLAFGRPVILTAGGRLSKAAQIGLFGFGDRYRATFEGSVVCLPTDWLTLGYELRTKSDPYGQIPGLVGEEDAWQAFSASWMVNSHLTVSALYGLMGTVGNAREDNTLGIQIRWEF